MLNLIPSPAITVNSHTSIGEAIQVMKTHDVGAVLVVDYEYPHALLGIFTERDLLKRAHELKNLKNWDQSISNVMTKNPTSISILDLEEAPERLAELGKRHLPITYQSETGHTHLAGIISMRDCFLKLLDEKKNLQKKNKELEIQGSRILIIAKNKTDQTLQERLLEATFKITLLDEVDFRLVDTFKLIVFDLDHYPAKDWAKNLQSLLAIPDHPPIILVYLPTLHQPDELKAIQSLTAGHAVFSFLKPLKVMDYLRVIRNSIVHQNEA